MIETKDKFVSTAITKSEKELIVEAAKEKSLRVSEYIRSTMIKDAEKTLKKKG